MPSSRTASAAAEAPPQTPDLTSPRVVRELLQRHGLTADKSLGQHFLIDRAPLGAIVSAAELAPDDEAWEVGPGLGTLTVELARRVRRVVTVELDRRLLPLLAETLAPWPHVEVVRADALRVDLERAAAGAVFVANLPYQVGTGVLSRVLACGRFRRAVVLVQKEVADRLVAAPGSAPYGSLSLWVAHHGRARIVRRVPPAPSCRRRASPRPSCASTWTRRRSPIRGPSPWCATASATGARRSSPTCAPPATTPPAS